MAEAKATKSSEKRNDNAFNHKTKPRGAFEPQTGAAERATKKASSARAARRAPQKQSGQEKYRGACGSVSIETPSGGLRFCALVGGDVRPRAVAGAVAAVTKRLPWSATSRMPSSCSKRIIAASKSC